MVSNATFMKAANRVMQIERCHNGMLNSYGIELLHETLKLLHRLVHSFHTIQRSCMLSTHSDEITSEVEFPLANDETDITILCAVHARVCLCMNV